MKRFFRVSSIEWRADGQKICSLGLPSELGCIELEADENDEAPLATIERYLEDTYGFRVRGFLASEIKAPRRGESVTAILPESQAPYCGTDLASGESWTVITVCDNKESRQEVVLGQLLIPTGDAAELTEEVQKALDKLSFANPRREWEDIRGAIVEIVKKHGIKIIEPGQTTVYG